MRIVKVTVKMQALIKLKKEHKSESDISVLLRKSRKYFIKKVTKANGIAFLKMLFEIRLLPIVIK